MKNNYLLFALLLSATSGLFAQVSSAVSGSCKDDANGLVKIVYDASLNCAAEAGTLEGSAEIGFHSGTENFGGSFVGWDAAGAVTGKNAGCNTFELTINLEEYYGVSYASVSNIAFVFNQGPEVPLDPWSLVGRDTSAGGYGCNDLLVTMADLPACPIVCEPDLVNYPGFGLWPDTLTGFLGASACDCTYEQPLTINVRDDTLIDVPGIGPILFEIVHFRLDSVGGFPPGFHIECEADNYRVPGAGQPISCVVDKLSNNCGVIKGNPQVAGPGTYRSTLFVTGKLYHPLTDTIESVDSFDQYTIVIDSCDIDCSSEDAPTGLSSSLDASGLTLSWDPIPNSVACQVRGGVAGSGSTSSRIVNGAPPSSLFIPVTRLTPGYTYDWAVRCACDIDPLDATPYSATASVSIPILRLSDVNQHIRINPNPADNQLTIELSSEIAGMQQFALTDISGKILLEKTFFAPVGVSHLELDLSSFAEGIYFLQSGNNVFRSQKLLIAR